MDKHIMPTHQEVLFWVYFWCGSAMFFVLLYLIIELHNNYKNKKK
jgi:hypothetical protein